jgi:pyruvate dehydrogenase complex dehydrogenase (E1) component
MTGFGASGPADALYRHFNITADAIVAAALAILELDPAAPDRDRGYPCKF